MPVKKVLFAVLIISIAMLAMGTVTQFADTVQARPLTQRSNPPGVTIPYPGRLTDDAGQPVTDGVYDFTFTLYGVQTGGEPLWSEVQRKVMVQNGSFHASLGSVNSIPTTALEDESWLVVALRGPGEAEFTALTPRQRLAAASPAEPASPTNGAACPHDHFGESWSGASSDYALHLSQSGGGDGLYVAQYGEGQAGFFGINNTDNESVALYVTTNSKGNALIARNTGTTGWGGVYGHSETGVGVFGEGWSYGLYSQGHLYVDGNSTVTGSKSGYVVDVAQNDDTVSLEAGDVVVISGVGEPVLGEIPVIEVRRAAVGETSAVVGVVDQHFTPALDGVTPAGVAEVTYDNAAIAPGEYLTVVTLGSYAAIKVDASYGAIAPGDLLVASPNPGYAMRAVSPQPGTIIGKALDGLPSGTGVIPVIVTLQ